MGMPAEMGPVRAEMLPCYPDQVIFRYYFVYMSTLTGTACVVPILRPYPEKNIYLRGCNFFSSLPFYSHIIDDEPNMTTKEFIQDLHTYNFYKN